MLTAAALTLCLALGMRTLAVRTRALAQRTDAAWDRAAASDDDAVVVVNVSELDGASYRRFAQALQTAGELGVPLITRVPTGLELPRAWSAIAVDTPVRTASIDVNGARATARCG